MLFVTMLILFVCCVSIGDMIAGCIIDTQDESKPGAKKLVEFTRP